MHLCRYARRVTLLVRGRSLAQSMSQYLREQLAAKSKIDLRLNTQIVDGGGAGRLEWRIRDRRSGETDTVGAAALFVLIGARPRTEWLPPEVERDPWGYVAGGTDVADAAAPWPLDRHPLSFETSVPGVFAVGDVRRRSVKRVASAMGEGSVVVQQAHQHLAAGGAEGTASVESGVGAGARRPRAGVP